MNIKNLNLFLSLIFGTSLTVQASEKPVEFSDLPSKTTGTGYNGNDHLSAFLDTHLCRRYFSFSKPRLDEKSVKTALVMGKAGNKTVSPTEVLLYCLQKLDNRDENLQELVYNILARKILPRTNFDIQYHSLCGDFFKKYHEMDKAWTYYAKAITFKDNNRKEYLENLVNAANRGHFEAIKQFCNQIDKKAHDQLKEMMLNVIDSIEKNTSHPLHKHIKYSVFNKNQVIEIFTYVYLHNVKNHLNAIFHEPAGDKSCNQIKSIFNHTYKIRENEPENPSEKLEYFLELSEYGNINAQNKAAALAYVADKYQLAAELFIRASDQGDPEATMFVGNMFEEGTGVDQNYKKAFECYEKAATLGNKNAWFYMGSLYEAGTGVEQNHRKAFECYEKSLNDEHPEIYTLLGKMYETGKGTDQNYIKALTCYKKAFNMGDMGASLALGTMYHHGNGVKQDFPTAFNYYKQSAHNNPAAQLGLALMYKNGLGIPKNDQMAFDCYKKAALKGIPIAQCITGLMCIKKNLYHEGEEWLRKAAEANEGQAMMGLILLCIAEGKYEEAESWLKKAKLIGEPLADKYEKLLERIGGAAHIDPIIHRDSVTTEEQEKVDLDLEVMEVTEKIFSLTESEEKMFSIEEGNIIDHTDLSEQNAIEPLAYTQYLNIRKVKNPKYIREQLKEIYKRRKQQEQEKNTTTTPGKIPEFILESKMIANIFARDEKNATEERIKTFFNNKLFSDMGITVAQTNLGFRIEYREKGNYKAASTHRGHDGTLDKGFLDDLSKLLLEAGFTNPNKTK